MPNNYFDRLIFAIAMLALSGCWGVPGLVWTTTIDKGMTVEGALNIGNKRPPILERCGTTALYANGPTCARAFVDSFGRRIDMAELRAELDADGEGIQQFQPFISKVGGRKESQLPYRLHILTISPPIVLAVPQNNRFSAPICGSSPILKSGCIQSMSFAGQAYWYRESPMKTVGSFWYSPEIPERTFPIDINLNNLEINVRNARLTLHSEGNFWKVSREK